jgi:DNA-binding transcriptional ArsR family regulator
MTRASSRAAPERDVLADAAEVFQLLSTPGRLHLIWLLSNNEVDVTTLVRAVGGTKAGISQHLAKLRLAGWIDGRRDGRRVLSTGWSIPTSSRWSTRPSSTSSTNEPNVEPDQRLDNVPECPIGGGGSSRHPDARWVHVVVHAQDNTSWELKS